MSDEREQAHVVSTYADDLVARRRDGTLEAPPDAESGLTEILDLTRNLSAIRIATPPRLGGDLWRSMTATAEAHAGDKRGGLFPWFRMRLVHPLPVFTVIAAAVAFWVLSQIRPEPVSAAELLRVSSAADAAQIGRPGFVVHRGYTVEARRLPGSTLIGTQRVELWVNPTTRVRARRVFDDTSRLLAGEWTNADGSRVVYERGRAPRREAPTETRPLGADTLWRWDPSAADYLAIVGQIEMVQAHATDGGYELTFDNPSGVVAEADLGLDRQRLGVRQRVVLRDRDGTLTEVRTARDSSDQIPESRVAAATFQPEAELLPAPPAAPIVTDARPAPVLHAPVVPTFSLDHIELQASYKIHRLGGCLVKPAEIRRAGTSVVIDVVVATDACRLEARRDFAGLIESTSTGLDVSVQPPATDDAPQLGAIEPHEVIDLSAIPVYQQLYELFARQALRQRQRTQADLDTAVKPLIQDFTSRTRNRASRVTAYAHAMSQLGERWSSETLTSLGLDAVAMWRAMVRDHARSLAQDTDVLFAELQTIGAVDADAFVAEPSPLRNLTDVRRAIGELDALARSNESAVRTLLSPAEGATDLKVPDSATLGRDLRRLARLAGRFAEPWSLER